MSRTPREDAPALPEPDRIEGAPHPRETPRLFGHHDAEQTILAAFNAGRLHHAWLIAGPQGVGKATLAWRIARFLIATPDDDGGMFAPPPPATLDIAEDHPVTRRLRALSESRLFLLRRGANSTGSGLSQFIRVEDVRDLVRFLSLSAADGGRRAVIVDAIDEMNTAAANALLKMLEEPPPRVTFLLVSHQPARLLPTIRSRCRTLPLPPLSPDDMARGLALAGIDAPDPAPLAELAGGSVGAAVRLVQRDGLDRYGALVALLATLPRLDRARMNAFADAAGARNAEGVFDLSVTLIDTALARAARAGATGHLPPEAAPGEHALLRKLAPDPASARALSLLAEGLAARARQGRAVNLDPAALLADMLLRIEQTATPPASPQARPTR
jgi:DNA polymerase-3 subunit delta'